MKKVLVFGLVCTLFLTGCGEKKLTCTMSADEMGMKASTKVVYTFDSKGEKLEKASIEADYEVSEELSEYLDMFKKSIEEDAEELNDIIKVKTSVKGNKISLRASYDASKLSKEQKEKLDYEEMYDNGNYNEVKASLEEEGYTCK